jgi:hypothetical protein
MSDLFDLPFEEDEPNRNRRRHPRVAARSDCQRATIRVRDLVEEAFPEVWVKASCPTAGSGTPTRYFTLKDASSQVRGVIFRTALRYLKFTNRRPPRRRARTRVGIRAEGRISAGLRAHGAAGSALFSSLLIS